MKPSKNKVHCYDCGRNKMLFESEKKALNFIKFNSENIEEENGIKPIRAYFCQSCCGWHITSKPEKTYKNTPTERVIELYNKEKEAKKNEALKKKMNISERIEKGKFTYIGLFLNEEQREQLKETFFHLIPLESKLYLDHCTILHKNQIENPKSQEIIDYVLSSFSKEEEVKITHIGMSYKTMAFKVEINVPCANDTPHITICTINDGRPVDSNYITNWNKLSKPINLKLVWKLM